MKEDFVAYDNLRVFPYEITHIKDLKVENGINNHAILKMTGIIDDEFKDSYIERTIDTTEITIYYETEGEDINIFKGVPTKIRVDVIEEVYTLSVEAISYTYKMDLYKVKRDFQDTNMTTHELISEVMETYRGAVYNINIPDEPIGKYILQYNETDYEFLKRIASFYHEPLITAMDYEGIHFYIGNPNLKIKPKAIITKYKIQKSIEEFYYALKNDRESSEEADFINYSIRTQEIYNVAEHFTFNNNELYVKEAEYKVDEGKLENIYTLVPFNGMKVNRIYNSKIIGVSITGSILQVQRDRVRVNLEVGNKTESKSAYWFPYATVAASPNGGGWYCMPEIGERIRLQCPTKDESKAFVISSIDSYEGKSGEEAENDRMSNTDNKSLQTAAGQEVNFTPNGINISSTGSQAVVELSKDGTVCITGQKDVNLACEQTLRLRAEEEIMIKAEENIDIQCETGGRIVMSSGDEISITGTRIANNG
ncbi:phage baseplate assembly protein V [Clostridium sp. HMSC19A10]|uniref:phage baseplate assembly protein V n=1 Tax=Clostridium sp. HMSC19A10 TaxID=1581148 RepID=UPI0008A42B27|nr:phage baseplate assembly protein V [Clostridium sp. HMSC19A10]OFS25011.1 hypothetical protein HMPREF3070_02965 [Clostridium sp. HMSC19A10]